MEQEHLQDALALVKRMGTLLTEFMDLSRQLAEALDRQDRVSVEMLVAMRGEPLDKLASSEAALGHLCSSLSDRAEGGRLAALLKGAAPEETQEQALAQRVAANRRLWAQACQLDKVLNAKLNRGQSGAQQPTLSSRA